MKKLTILLCLFLAFAFAEWDVDPDYTNLTADTISNDSSICFNPKIAKFDSDRGIYFDTTLSGDSLWIHPLGFYKDGQVSMGYVTMRDSVGGGLSHWRMDMLAFFPPYFWHNFDNDAADFWCLKLKGSINHVDSVIGDVDSRPEWHWGHFDRSTHTFEQSAEVYLFFLDVAENIRMSKTTANCNIYAVNGADLELRSGLQLDDTLFIQTDTTITCVGGALAVNGRISGGLATITTTADDIPVDSVFVLNVNTTGGNVTIGSFMGGVANQILHIFNSATNNIIFEDDEGTAGQDIKTPTAADITITAEGGATLVCDGSLWYIIGIAQ